MRTLVICLSFLLLAHQVHAQTPSTLGAPYVVVEDSSQLHSNQIFGAEPGPLLDEVDAAAKRLNGTLVKVNVVAVDDATVASLTKEVNARYANALPVITAVVGKLSRAEAKLGLDVVIAFKTTPKAGVRVEEDPFGRIVHPSPLVYVSGQAEKSDMIETAAFGTMSHLRDTLLAMDMSLDDVVQIRAFLTPVRIEKRIQAEIEKVLGDRKIPIVFVDWKSSLPIEIELIGSSPSKDTKQSLEFITPLGLPPSPLYARVTKLNNRKLIYIGGLYGTSPGELKPDVEVKEIFGTLQSILDKTGSDMEHLVKATYFCSSDGTSTQLNALRPSYYNPSRPPAASKAIVPGVGQPSRFITLDMIATPKP